MNGLLRFLTLTKVRRWIKRLGQAILISALCNDELLNDFMTYTQWRIFNYGSYIKTKQGEPRFQQEPKNTPAEVGIRKTIQKDDDTGLQLSIPYYGEASKSGGNLED